MSFISFSQNLEDLMLWRALEKFGPGFYIDVGACDPVVDSVTKVFYDAGWRGINIEPMQTAFEKIKDMRPRDINLNIGLDSHSGFKTFYSVDEGNGLSTSVQKYAEHYINEGRIVQEEDVAISTLDEIFETYVNQEVHFLKIDVEGSEKQVLEGSEFKNFRPWVILIESTIPNTSIPSNEEWEYILVNANYNFVYFDGLNRYYIANEKKDELEKHFTSPPNLFDNFQKASDFFALQELNSYKSAAFEIKDILSSSAQSLNIEETCINEACEITPELLINKYKIITDEMNELKNKYFEEIKQINTQHEDLMSDTKNQHENLIKNINTENENIIKEIKCESDKKINSLETIINEKSLKNNILNLELDNCIQELYESSRYISALCKDRHNATLQLNDMNHRLNALNDIQTQLKAEIARLETAETEAKNRSDTDKKRINQLEEREAILSHEVNALRQSRSWKITQPLRSALLAIRKLGAKND